MKQIAKQNETFKAWEPTWANACVGENGDPQIYEYASGYASATNLLLDQVIENEGRSLYVDTLIYPICFNMRHAIELFLKAAAVSLEKLAKIRSTYIPAFDLLGSHDLGNIWTYVRKHALQFDLRYIEVMDKLERYVVEVAETDATGQVFRYLFDLNNNKHLTSVSAINVVILKSRWTILEKLLKHLNRLNEDLLIEYGWGAFTAKLSRPQLARIAGMLPWRDQWSSPEFDRMKSVIRGEYRLSCNDFSKALNKIQSRQELGALCKHVSPIPGLDANALMQFFDIWIKKHELRKIVTSPLERDSGFDVSQPDFKEMIAYAEKSTQLKKELVETIRPDTFAALFALFYFDREDNFSEIFEKLLTQYQKKSLRYTIDRPAYLNDARQLLEKTAALTSILNSLNFLGQTDLVNVVIERYKLQDQVSRLLEESNQARQCLVQSGTYI